MKRVLRLIFQTVLVLVGTNCQSYLLFIVLLSQDEPKVWEYVRTYGIGIMVAGIGGYAQWSEESYKSNIDGDIDERPFWLLCCKDLIDVV